MSKVFNIVRTDEKGNPLVDTAKNNIPYVLVDGIKTYLYEEKADGHGTICKIANPMHPDNCPLTGSKIIDAIDKRKRHDLDLTLYRVDNPQTGITYGEVTTVDNHTKQFLFKPHKFVALQELDMAKYQDRVAYMVVSHHSAMAGSPFPSSHAPYLKVLDREAEAEAVILNVNFRNRAERIIGELRSAELVNSCINMGLDAQYNSESIMKAELLKLIQQEKGGVSKAKEFCEMYDNVNRQAVTIFRRCMVVGLVKSDATQGYLFKGTTLLGTTESAVIGYMNTHLPTMQVMDYESKMLSPAFNKYATKEEKETVTSKLEEQATQNDQYHREVLTNADIDRKMGQVDAELKELREMKEQLAGLIKEKQKVNAEGTVTEEKVKPWDKYELSKLQDMATELKITWTEDDTKEQLYNTIAKKQKENKAK